MMDLSEELAARLVKASLATIVWPRNLVGASDRLLVVPFVRLKLALGENVPFSIDKETHLGGFRLRPKSLQAELIL